MKSERGDGLHANGRIRETVSSRSSTASEKNSSSCLFIRYHALLPAVCRCCARSGKSVRGVHGLLPRVSVLVQLSPDTVTHRCSAGGQSPAGALEDAPDLSAKGRIPLLAGKPGQAPYPLRHTAFRSHLQATHWHGERHSDENQRPYCAPRAAAMPVASQRQDC